MDANEFKSLRYGNTIISGTGQRFMVTLTTRDHNGDCIAASIVPAIQLEDADQYSVVSKDFNQTLLKGETVPGS